MSSFIFIFLNYFYLAQIQEVAVLTLRQLREMMGFKNQTDFAHALKKSVQSIQNYERGSRMPQHVVGKICEMAEARGVTLAQLSDFTDTVSIARRDWQQTAEPQKRDATKLGMPVSTEGQSDLEIRTKAFIEAAIATMKSLGKDVLFNKMHINIGELFELRGSTIEEQETHLAVELIFRRGSLKEQKRAREALSVLAGPLGERESRKVKI